MSTVREKILAYLRDHGGPVTPAALGQEVDGSMGAIYEALRVMVERGELVRDGVGVYQVTQAGKAAVQAVAAPAPEPAKAPPPTVRPKARFTPAPEPAPAATQETKERPAEPAAAEDADNAPEPLQWALWNDGDLLLRRGEVSFVLTSDERRRLMGWLRNGMAT